MTAPSTALLETSGEAGGPTPTVWSPDAFAERCREIVSTMREHPAHRALDLLTNEVLSSLGYGEGIAIFEQAVRDWHRDGLPYPNKPSWWARPLACKFGRHDWEMGPDTGWLTIWSAECRRCGKSESSGNPCP